MSFPTEKTVMSMFARHILFGGLTGLSLVAAIVVSVFVLFGGLAVGWLWLWAVFFVFSIITIVNYLLFFKKLANAV